MYEYRFVWILIEWWHSIIFFGGNRDLLSRNYGFFTVWSLTWNCFMCYSLNVPVVDGSLIFGICPIVETTELLWLWGTHLLWCFPGAGRLLTASVCTGCAANKAPAMAANWGWNPTMARQTRVKRMEAVAWRITLQAWNQIGCSPTKACVALETKKIWLHSSINTRDNAPLFAISIFDLTLDGHRFYCLQPHISRSKPAELFLKRFSSVFFYRME